MGGRSVQLALVAALAACVGCGGESLGGHPPAGLVGTGGGVVGSGRGGSPAAGGSGGDIGGNGGDAGGGGDSVGAGNDIGTGFGGALGDGGAVGSGGTGPFCGSFETVVAPVPEVLVLLDRSSSMNDDTNGVSCTGGCGPTSKWAVLGAALDQLVHENTSVSWGLAFFGADDQCGVNAGAAVDVGPNSASAIEGQLGTVRPGGGEAPTAAAIYAASAYLQSRLDTGSKFILLATDGHSGCATSNGVTADSAAASAATTASDEGVTTVVVGVAPASDSAATLALNDIALSGGAPATGPNAFYTMADFTAQFPPAAAAGSCAVSLPQPAAGRELAVDLVGSGGELTAVPEDPVSGWSFSAAMDSIMFNGPSCLPGSPIQITYLCVVPPLGHGSAQK